MILLFDCNCYDKLIELSDKSLEDIITKVDKLVMPQAVREQLDMMADDEDKMEKLSKINQLISRFDIEGRLEKVEGLFEDVCDEDVKDWEMDDEYEYEDDGAIEEDKKNQREYYSNVIFPKHKVPHNKSLGIITNKKSAYFKSLPDKMKNGDKEIALTARQEGAIVITNDGSFLAGLKSINQEVLQFNEFLNVMGNK